MKRAYINSVSDEFCKQHGITDQTTIDDLAFLMKAVVHKAYTLAEEEIGNPRRFDDLIKQVMFGT